MAVNVAAFATLMDGGDLETVKTSFTGALADLFRNAALRTNVVSHAKADAVADKNVQVCISTADEGLSLWERDYGLSVREGASLEDRRAVVRAAIAGDGS